jgi:hypothetical protein
LKKTYNKPSLERREKLSKATALKGESIINQPDNGGGNGAEQV